MLKNILFGLGSVGVVGGGGYMIYNATRSEDYKSVGVSDSERADENNTQTTTVSDGVSQGTEETKKAGGTSEGGATGPTEREGQGGEASGSDSSSESSSTGSTK